MVSVEPVVAFDTFSTCGFPFVQVSGEVIEQEHLFCQRIQPKPFFHKIRLINAAWDEQPSFPLHFREIFIHPALFVLQGLAAGQAAA